MTFALDRWLALPLLLLLAGPLAADPILEQARQYHQQHGPRIVREFADFLTIPNVATDTVNVRRTASFIVKALSQRGVETELLELDDERIPPIVFGQLLVEGAEHTLGVYVHYDGQPVEEDQWTHPPWQATLYTDRIDRGGQARPLPQDGETIDDDWRLYARSAADDKAPIPAILAALDILRENGQQPTSNLIFFFEGEEEFGSPRLNRYLERYKDRLQVDGWLICDGPGHQSGLPQLVFGVRGVVNFTLTTYGANTYLHSGHYGNWSPNPALRLAKLLASMKDENDQVVVEGFYDTTAPLSTADRAALATIPSPDESLRQELGLAATDSGNAPLMEQILRPSLNIRGMKSANIGRKARNVIPSTATASLDIRLTSGNDPQAMLRLVEEHIRKQGYHLVDEDPDHETRLAHPLIARFIHDKGYPAVRTAIDSAFAQRLIAGSKRVAGDDLVLTPTLGGSLPLFLFEQILGSPLIVVPIANHDNNQHGPDENLRLGNLWYGIELMTSLFTMD